MICMRGSRSCRVLRLLWGRSHQRAGCPEGLGRAIYRIYGACGVLRRKGFFVGPSISKIEEFMQVSPHHGRQPATAKRIPFDDHSLQEDLNIRNSGRGHLGGRADLS